MNCRNWVLLGLTLLFLSPCSVEAQVMNLIERYHRDQPVRRIVIDTPVYLGRVVDGKRFLTEREAIEMALTNNLDINVQRHSRLLSTWDIAFQKGFYDASAGFGVNWDRETTPTASVLQGGTSVTDILTNYNFFYRKPFSTGSTFEVNFVGLRNRTTNFFSSLVPAINSQFEVLFRQNLLEGLGVTPAEYEIEISRNNLEISEQEFRRQAIEVISQVQNAYWELEYYLKDIEVKEKSLEYADTVLNQNQARFEVGTASRLELVETEAEVASRRQELITSRYNYRRAMDTLVKLVTGHVDPRVFEGEVVPVGDYQGLDAEPEDFDHLLKVAAELRPEIQQADLDIANLEVDLERTRDKLRPTLELTAGYQQFGLGGTQVLRDFSQGFFNPPVVAVIEGGLGDSLSELFSGNFYGYVLGVNLQFPLGNTEARAENAKAQINLNRSQLEKASVRQSIGLEIRDALTQIEMNRARLEASQITVRAAEERLEGEQARFEVGMGTTRELIEAQRDLLAAAGVEVRARTDLIKSKKLLDKVVGRTFQVQNIELEESLQTNVVGTE